MLAGPSSRQIAAVLSYLAMMLVVEVSNSFTERLDTCSWTILTSSHGDINGYRLSVSYRKDATGNTDCGVFQSNLRFLRRQVISSHRYSARFEKLYHRPPQALLGQDWPKHEGRRHNHARKLSP